MQLIYTVPQSHCVVIERFGKFSRIQRAGVRFRIPLLEKISAQSKYTAVAPTERISPKVVERVHNAVSKAVVPLAIDLGTAMLPVRELVNLQIGDIIELNTSVSGQVNVLVGDAPKFMAHPGKVGERTAVQISGYIK